MMSYTKQRHSKLLESASRHPRLRQPKSSSFLHLPGEIRNKIYDLLFAGHVLIHRSHPVRERLEYPEVKTSLHLRSRRISVSTTGTHFYIGPDLLRVCRQVHDEAVTFLYANTTFRFESVLTMNKFLNIAPAVAAIKRLELRHSTYGEPRLTEDRKWKQRHDKKWMKTCRRIAEKMTALEHLTLELRICDWPMQLNLTAAWAKPLLELKGNKGIDQVEVTLIHDAFSEQRLQATANVVALAMMTKEGRLRREVAKSAADIEWMNLRGGLVGDRFARATKNLAIKPRTILTTHANNKAQATGLDREKFNSVGLK